MSLNPATEFIAEPMNGAARISWVTPLPGTSPITGYRLVATRGTRTLIYDIPVDRTEAVIGGLENCPPPPPPDLPPIPAQFVCGDCQQANNAATFTTSGVQVGDTMLIAAYATDSPLVDPAGWNVLLTTDDRTKIYTRTADVTDVGSHTYTLLRTVLGGFAERTTAALAVYRSATVISASHRAGTTLAGAPGGLYAYLAPATLPADGGTLVGLFVEANVSGGTSSGIVAPLTNRHGPNGGSRGSGCIGDATVPAGDSPDNTYTAYNNYAVDAHAFGVALGGVDPDA
jgi:hypothetical protein